LCCSTVVPYYDLENSVSHYCLECDQFSPCHDSTGSSILWVKFS
jgi:hypothetical protein